ncbi:uncharacterized protein BDR25DRAFT_357086 [Lindgomyces ingoldianus]|uniref:Uncharacterized protein n=1 Tax=Lindgomyces ingoldianus TaxID=673940 RepID=A0ACB6QNX3_9PLEO|nr:uncharacterized protein BDR25DRAFT_357086 [Lindgomyces ingoldianus]KAF2468719.1 hypothetical protein BDR25DRAFT_357086 [Lindgomyces ingoldianus]
MSGGIRAIFAIFGGFWQFCILSLTSTLSIRLNKNPFPYKYTTSNVLGTSDELLGHVVMEILADWGQLLSASLSLFYSTNMPFNDEELAATLAINNTYIASKSCEKRAPGIVDSLFLFCIQFTLVSVRVALGFLYVSLQLPVLPRMFAVLVRLLKPKLATPFFPPNIHHKHSYDFVLVLAITVAILTLAHHVYYIYATLSIPRSTPQASDDTPALGDRTTTVSDIGTPLVVVLNTVTITNVYESSSVHYGPEASVTLNGLIEEDSYQHVIPQRHEYEPPPYPKFLYPALFSDAARARTATTPKPHTMVMDYSSSDNCTCMRVYVVQMYQFWPCHMDHISFGYDGLEFGLFPESHGPTRGFSNTFLTIPLA